SLRRSLRVGIRGHAAARPVARAGAGSHRLPDEKHARRHPYSGHRLLPEEVAGSAWNARRPRVYWRSLKASPMNLLKLPRLFAGVAVLLVTASTALAEVKVSMQDGRVTIVAKDATLRQILTEWARVGETKIVNVERIPGGPMTLELTNVPEQQALELL